MNFSTVQQKELIDVASGKSLGYIMDAYVQKDTGQIDYFIVEQPRKFYNIVNRETNSLKVKFNQIVALGSDVILISLK